MVESLKKTLFASIGAVYLTKEKIKELGEKFVKDTKLSEQEGKKFIDELLHKSDDAKKALEKTVQEIIENTLTKLNIPTRKEIEDLTRRVENIESAIDTKE